MLGVVHALSPVAQTALLVDPSEERVLPVVGLVGDAQAASDLGDELVQVRGAAVDGQRGPAWVGEQRGEHRLGVVDQGDQRVVLVDPVVVGVEVVAQPAFAVLGPVPAGRPAPQDVLGLAVGFAGPAWPPSIVRVAQWQCQGSSGTRGRTCSSSG